MRLDRFLAESAVGTKKEVRSYVLEGKVSVNHLIMQNPAMEIEENTDIVQCDGRDVIYTGKKYYMLNKPAGCITARTDEHDKTVLDLIDDRYRDGLFPVGRLDKDTEGLLLLTNDGEFSHRLMHPDKHVDKTYFFWVFGDLDDKAIECLMSGVRIGEDECIARAVECKRVEQGLFSDFEEKMKLDGSREIRFNRIKQSVSAGYLTISEGRKHQIKRMLKSVGCYVVYLKRVSIGTLLLDETLNKGEYRELSAEELTHLTYGC